MTKRTPTKMPSKPQNGAPKTRQNFSMISSMPVNLLSWRVLLAQGAAILSRLPAAGSLIVFVMMSGALLGCVSKAEKEPTPQVRHRFRTPYLIQKKIACVASLHVELTSFEITQKLQTSKSRCKRTLHSSGGFLYQIDLFEKKAEKWNPTQRPWICRPS